MSVKEVYVVARVCNASETLCVKSADPKVVARYIDDNRLYDALLGICTVEGLRTVVVGAYNKEEGTHVCLMVGATVPVEHNIEYSNVIKGFDDVLSPINSKSMFWSHNATYVIIDSTLNNCGQVEWWKQVIKEMSPSYQIEESK